MLVFGKTHYGINSFNSLALAVFGLRPFSWFLGFIMIASLFDLHIFLWQYIENVRKYLCELHNLCDQAASSSTCSSKILLVK